MPQVLPLATDLLLRAAATLLRRGDVSTAPAPALQFIAPPLSGQHLARFRAGLGFPQEGLPLSYLYLLAQRAQLAMLTGPAFPLAVPGLIHTHNHMERLGDPDPGQSWELGTEARLFADERGRSRVELKVLFGQEGRSIATCTSAYLAPQARSGPRITEGAALSPGAPEGESTGLELDLSGSAGRSYARLSCDWNPIHLWQLTARLFGLKQPIIHGMYLLALAERHAQEQFGQPITHLAGTFARPVGLPGRIRLSLGAPAPDGTEFQIRDIRADRLAVTGSLRI